MKTALLIPAYDTINKNEFYEWQTPNERTLSVHNTKEEALQNKPDGYKCLDDGWNEI